MSGGAFFEVNAGSNGIAQAGIGQLQLLDFESPISLAHKFRLIELANDIMDVIVDIVGVMHRDEVGINELRHKRPGGTKNGGTQVNIIMVIHGQIEETATMHREINAGIQNHGLEFGLIQSNILVVDNHDVLRINHFVVRGIQNISDIVGFDDAETFALAVINKHVFDREFFLRVKRGDFGLSESMKPFRHIAATDNGNIGQVLSLMEDPVNVLNVILSLGILSSDDGVVRQHLTKATVFI